MSFNTSRETTAAGDAKQQRLNGDLLMAILSDNDKKVVEFCQKLPDHAMHILTVNNDTVLHFATYAKKEELVLQLLDKFPDHHLDKMTRQNDHGNTVLHEAAIKSKCNVAAKMLSKVPGLLGMHNTLGETAFFRAARCGNTEVFKFLAAKISQHDPASHHFYLHRRDKTTILHISTLAHKFDLALQIANEYPQLIDERDADGMTALQLLACDSYAFEPQSDDDGLLDLVKFCVDWKWRKEVREKKGKLKSAPELAAFLVKQDTSWQYSYSHKSEGKPRIHKYGADKSEQQSSVASLISPSDRIIETPLILAAKSGCLEIVKEILKLYPQAIEYVDDEGRFVLHVAIKYNKLDIFKLVSEMEVLTRRMVGKTDYRGNTILHYVAIKGSGLLAETVEGPALQLQEELLWFKRVKRITPDYLIQHRNYENLTAEEKFKIANSELRNSAKEWMKRTAEGCSVVAVLIATVAFAAAYTVPGGSDDKTGLPVLLQNPYFVVFTIADSLSLTSALASVVTFLSILSSPYRFSDFRHSLPNKLNIGFGFLFLSVALMMVAFAATIVLIINKKENWTQLVLYTLSFIPVAIFALTYFPIYASFHKTCKYLLKKTFASRKIIKKMFNHLFHIESPPTDFRFSV